MAGRDEKKVIVKKVRAFPIAAELKVRNSAVKANILRLNTRGLLAEVALSDLEPGEKCEFTFEIPVLHFVIHEPMVVIKQYSQWQGGVKPAPANTTTPPPASAGVGHLVEAHFSALSESGRERIAAFLKAIGSVEN